MTMTEAHCRVCNGRLPDDPLVRLPNMPGSVQNLYGNRKSAQRASATLDVRQCIKCGHVQLTNDPVPYYRDVIRAGRFSESLTKRQRDVFARFIDRFGLQGKRVLEVGSGRGEYLTILNALPVSAYGLENNAEFCAEGAKEGLRLFNGFVTDPSLAIDPPRFDAAISINFLEHVPDPTAFLRAMGDLMEPDAIGLVSVPDAARELADNSLLSYMSDHLSYFTPSSLAKTIELGGFAIEELYRNDALNVLTATFRKPAPVDLTAHNATFAAINDVLAAFVNAARDDGLEIAMWGASHLAFSMLSMSSQYDRIAYIVDSAPFKQGRYAPVSGLEIFPPAHLNDAPVGAILVFCPEYSDEIVRSIRGGYGSIRRIGTFVDGSLRILSRNGPSQDFVPRGEHHG